VRRDAKLRRARGQRAARRLRAGLALASTLTLTLTRSLTLTLTRSLTLTLTRSLTLTLTRSLTLTLPLPLTPTPNPNPHPHQEHGPWEWSGTPPFRFKAGGVLDTPWGAGRWGPLGDGER
jgi:hypothetical protein